MKDCIGYKVFKAILGIPLGLLIGYVVIKFLESTNMSRYDLMFLLIACAAIGIYWKLLWTKIKNNQPKE